MNLKEMIEKAKYHRTLAAAYRACGNENLAKLEDEEAAKWTRKSYRFNKSRV
jgi:hypothetical protein